MWPRQGKPRGRIYIIKRPFSILADIKQRGLALKMKTFVAMHGTQFAGYSERITGQGTILRRWVQYA